MLRHTYASIAAKHVHSFFMDYHNMHATFLYHCIYKVTGRNSEKFASFKRIRTGWML